MTGGGHYSIPTWNKNILIPFDSFTTVIYGTDSFKLSKTCKE